MQNSVEKESGFTVLFSTLFASPFVAFLNPRFFKLFALLNLHNIGIEKYSRFLCTKISAEVDSILQRAREDTTGTRDAMWISPQFWLLFARVKNPLILLPILLGSQIISWLTISGTNVSYVDVIMQLFECVAREIEGAPRCH